MRNTPSHQPLKNGPMRVVRRSVVVLALATAGAWIAAAVVLAEGDSTATVDFSPSALPPPGTGYTSGKLAIHTHTSYSKPGSAQGGATQRGQLYFDDDLKFNTNAVPKCSAGSISGQITLQQAMAACGSSLVGKGTIKAIAPNSAPDPADNSFIVRGCLRIFNGQGSTSELLLFTRTQISDPSAINCSTNGTQGNFTNLLAADLTANPTSAGADYADPDNCSAPSRLGCQLDIPNITSATPLPLSDFNASLQQGSFVAARCDDTPQQLNLKAKFTYNDATTQTVNALSSCS